MFTKDNCIVAGAFRLEGDNYDILFKFENS